MRELLIDKGVFTADEVRKQVENMDSRSPAQGARVVAQSVGRSRVQEVAACQTAAGMRRRSASIADPTSWWWSRTRPSMHNVIVCTLCSCYPRRLLGLPPDWYKSRAYRSRAVREPRSRPGRVRHRRSPDDVDGARA